MSTATAEPARAAIPAPRTAPLAASAPEEVCPRHHERAARLGAEALGTAILVLAVAGTAVLTAGLGPVASSAGPLPVALALGLSVLVGINAFGRFSGGHFNPAVTIGLAVAGRFPWRDVPGYAVAQTAGALVGGCVVRAVAEDAPSSFAHQVAAGGFASTGWGPLSPGGFGMGAAFLIEIMATAVLVSVVLGVTARSADESRVGVTVGATLTLIGLVAIPVSNGSFNPARSIATAVWGGPIALSQLWLSIAAPVAGAVLAGAVVAVCGVRRRRRTRRGAPAAREVLPSSGGR